MSKLFAEPSYAAPIVFKMVDAINRHMNETVYVIPKRDGFKRRIAREKAQAKAMAPWHKSAAKARKDLPKSRQVIRRMERMQIKSMYAAMRAEARSGGLSA